MQAKGLPFVLYHHPMIFSGNHIKIKDHGSLKLKETGVLFSSVVFYSDTQIKKWTQVDLSQLRQERMWRFDSLASSLGCFGDPKIIHGFTEQYQKPLLLSDFILQVFSLIHTLRNKIQKGAVQKSRNCELMTVYITCGPRE